MKVPEYRIATVINLVCAEREPETTVATVMEIIRRLAAADIDGRSGVISIIAALENGRLELLSGFAAGEFEALSLLLNTLKKTGQAIFRRKRRCGTCSKATSPMRRCKR